MNRNLGLLSPPFLAHFLYYLPLSTTHNLYVHICVDIGQARSALSVKVRLFSIKETII